MLIRSSDDEAAGLGGTLLKYIEEGYSIIKIVFSSGEMSHPHYKKDIIIKSRMSETIKISKKYGIKENVFFGLEDAKLKTEISADIKSMIKDIIKKYNPEKIFIPSEHDPHFDHRAVSNAVLKVLKKLKYSNGLYFYEVWNLKKENYPIVYINITNYFKQKIRMMKEFKSQWYFMYLLLLPIYLRARFFGIKAKCKYAERFYKIR